MQYREFTYDTGVWDSYFFEKNMLGDVVAVYDANGTKLMYYTYDASGQGGGYSQNGGQNTGAAKNPFRYRGYYYDKETGFYYLNSRYYDPILGRFISPDSEAVITATPTALTDKNLYAYCDNNPVSRYDHGGAFWDTFFDIFSLGASIIEVCCNPSDPWAWAGLVGDFVDLVPFVSGVGEITDAARVATKADDIVDSIQDGVKITKATDFTSDARKLVDSLDHTGDVTRSSASAGRKIHSGYKTGYEGIEGMTKEAVHGKNRIDFLDSTNKIIYELKPNNPRSIKQGIKQLKRYNDSLGGGYTLILELY